jgi:hypothetical protein
MFRIEPKSRNDKRQADLAPVESMPKDNRSGKAVSEDSDHIKKFAGNKQR